MIRVHRFRYLGRKGSMKAVKFKLAQYVNTSDIKLPVSFGHVRESTTYGMLGNDEAGDCVIADLAHSVMIRCQATRRAVPPFTTSSTLDTYSKITGYDPKKVDYQGNNPTDQGTDMVTAAAWARDKGIPDATGELHKIKAYGEIAFRDWDELIKAIYLFGTVSLGIMLPQSASDQFDRMVPWTITGDGSIIGGHAITACGKNSAGFLVALTWGRTTAISRQFIERYLDQGIVSLSPEYLKDTGHSPELFDEAQLTTDLASLTRTV
jgi:hypothetical protein